MRINAQTLMETLFHLCTMLRLLPLVALVGCGQPPPASQSPTGPIPAEPQRSGDPQAGYRALVNHAYVTCGMPYAAFARAQRERAPTFTLAGREGRNAELPYMFNAYTAASGVELVTTNCLMCHAAPFNGQLVIGLGNEFLDFTSDASAPVESAGAYVTGAAAAKEWRKWADRIAAIAPYMMTDTVGVNPAPNLTTALVAHRDPKTLAWSEQPRMAPPPTAPLPVSVPPWWRLHKKNAMFYHGGGRGDQARIMMAKALVCTDDVEEARAIDAYFPDIRAYLLSLRPPAYPFAIDHDLAARGRTVFEAHCSACHGVYGAAASYPNLIVGLEQIGTDPEYALQATREGERFIQWFNQSFYGEKARAAPAPGYIAPPLDGIWATAPFLHNGSVPTIAALLESGKRPRYWTRRFDAREFDQDALGWRFTVLDHGKAGEADSKARKRIYDTTLRGYGNSGHTFGDALSEAERKAVLEYLKTL